MRRPGHPLALVCAAALLLSACSPGGGGGGGQAQSKPDYKEMKQMVVDILQTEDGKKAIRDVLKHPEFRQQIVVNDEMVRSTVERTLTDPKNQKQFSEMLKDPRVAGAFAKAFQREQRQLHKDLMKDPEYLKAWKDALRDPEFQKIFLDLMDTPQFRQHLMRVMKDALQSPYFRLEVMELMQKASEDMLTRQKKGKKGEASGGGGGQQGGGGGGGGGGM